LALLLLAYLLPIMALAAPDEASGVVTNVVDGDTFDLRIEKTDPRILYEIERVRLADVDSPEKVPLWKSWILGRSVLLWIWLRSIWIRAATLAFGKLDVGSIAEAGGVILGR
jgi:hypothetical protein